MNKQAFTLVELLVSLTISTLLLASLLRFAHQTTLQMKATQQHMRITESLNIAREELLLASRGLEPAFWKRFPLVQQAAHDTDHSHGGLQWASHCEQLPKSACLTMWDLCLTGEDPVVYRTLEHEFPEMVRLTSEGNGPPGPADEVGPMSVLLFFHARESFCALVESVSVDQVTLVGLDQQPWSLPEHFEPDKFKVVHLGMLKVTHCGLENTAAQGAQLVYQPWLVSDGDWSAQRRYSSVSNLLKFVWQPCDEDRPDRLTLLAGVQGTNERFDLEVAHASLEF